MLTSDELPTRGTSSQEAQPVTQAQARPRSERLYFIDNLRAVVAVLIVLMHLAIMYGGLGGEATIAGQMEPVFGLLWYSMVGQALLLGLFFLLSGYFTPASYDRKGLRAFLLDRLVRLGIPLLVYDLLINPLILYVRQNNGLAWSGEFWGGLLQNYPGYLNAIGTGPVWFLWNLLLFTAVYALWRSLSRAPATAQMPPPPLPAGRIHLYLLLGVLAMALLSFGIRILFPIGWYTPLNLRLPYYAHYLGLFVLGMIAYRRSWLDLLTPAIGRLWLWAGLLALMFFPLVIGLADFGALAGGLRPAALIYAFWEALIQAGLGVGLLAIYRQFFNRQNGWDRFLAANAYAVYLVHIPVIFFVALGLRGFGFGPLLTLILATLLTLPLCYALSTLLRRLPLAERVL